MSSFLKFACTSIKISHLFVYTFNLAQNTLAGEWVLPCVDCRTGYGCNWQQARWQPSTCHYRKLKTTDLKQCMAGRTLMFLGDSTNRGIAHHIIQEVNGSLTEGGKTHTTRDFGVVNDNRTRVTFAYYPHFWLPADHRPTFKKVLYQLIKRCLFIM